MDVGRLLEQGAEDVAKKPEKQELQQQEVDGCGLDYGQAKWPDRRVMDTGPLLPCLGVEVHRERVRISIFQ